MKEWALGELAPLFHQGNLGIFIEGHGNFTMGKLEKYQRSAAKRMIGPAKLETSSNRLQTHQKQHKKMQITSKNEFQFNKSNLYLNLT
jgi:hypothetical protein